MFSLICAWINGWVNNREAGALRRHRAHYDVIVMGVLVGFTPCLSPTFTTDDTKHQIYTPSWYVLVLIGWWPGAYRATGHQPIKATRGLSIMIEIRWKCRFIGNHVLQVLFNWEMCIQMSARANLTRKLHWKRHNSFILEMNTIKNTALLRIYNNIDISVFICYRNWISPVCWIWIWDLFQTDMSSRPFLNRHFRNSALFFPKFGLKTWNFGSDVCNS